MAYEQTDFGQAVVASAMTETLSAITICGWLRADDDAMPTEGNGRILQKPSTGYDLRINGTTSRLRFRRQFTGVGSVNGQWRTANGSIVFGTLYHFAVTYDDATGIAADAQFYLDGVAVTTIEQNTPVGTPDSSAQTTRYGNTNTGSTNTFDGVLSDIRVYNRVLSADEIRTIFQTRGTDGIVNGLQLRYEFMQGPAGGVVTDPVIDASQNGFTGTPGKEPNSVNGIDSFTNATATIVLDAAEGDQTKFYATDRVFTVSGATNPSNDGTYTVVSSSFAVNTSIVVTPAPPVDEAASPAVATIVFADAIYQEEIFGVRLRRRTA